MKVLIAGLGAHREFGLMTLRNAGHFVGVLDTPDRVPVDLCDWWAPADVTDPASLTVAALAAPAGFDAIVCWQELAVDAARQVALTLGVPSPRVPPGVFRDKAVMHARLAAAGLPSPQLGCADSREEALRLASTANFPVVVKPADGGASGGVTVVDDPTGLDTAFDVARAHSLTGRAVVDRYVSGPEFSVEAVTWAPGDTTIVAVTEKQTTAPPYCAELGHVVPAALSCEQHDAIARTVAQTVDVLGLDAGVTHTEVKLEPTGGVVIIETAARPAGGNIAKLVQLATGWNLYLAELAAVTGERLQPQAPAAPAAAIRFFGTMDGGLVVRPRDPIAHSPEHVRRYLHELKYWAPSGVRVPPLRGNSDRLGYAVFAGPDEDVRRASADALGLGPRVLP